MSHSRDEQKSHPDMRVHENRELLTNIEHHHLNIDGTADLRYNENHQKIITNDIKGIFNLFKRNNLVKYI